MEQPNNGIELYVERLLPGVSAFLAAGLLLPAVSLIVAPFSIAAGIAMGAALASTTWLLLIIRSPIISLTKTELRVGRAVIERKWLGVADVVLRDRLFTERGPNLDARAFTCFQVGVQKAIRVEIADDDDPTPYWLFCTRNPEHLAKLLNEQS